MPDCYAENADGLILVANGIDPVRRWDGYAESFAPAGLAAPTVEVTATGSGSGGLTGTYVVYICWFDAEDNESSLSPVSGEIVLANSQAVAGTHSEVMPERAIGYRFYRTTNGQRRVAYLDAEVEINTSLQRLSSMKTDADLTASRTRPLLSSLNEYVANFSDPPPNDRPLILWHNGRMYAAGVEAYSEGSAEVVAGQKLVVGHGTNWVATFADRFFSALGGDKGVQIESVDVAAQTVSLVDPWSGPTDLFAGYTIRPAPATENLLLYSEPGKAEQWSPLKAVPISEDGEFPTALYNLGAFMFIAKRRKTYRYTVQTDPLLDGFLFLAISRGAVNNRCVVPVDQGAFCLDDRGVYQFVGGEDANPVSGDIEDIFRGDGRDAINWRASRYFFGVNCPTEDSVRFFVCLRGDYLPRHALVYQYLLGRWAIEEYPFPVSCGHLGVSGRPTSNWRRGDERVYLGGPAGRAYTLGGSALDGTDAGGGRPLALAAATATRLTLAGGLAGEAGLVGASAAVATGRATGQTRMIVAATATVLTLDRPMIPVPAAGDMVVVGGIPYRYLTAKYRYGAGETDQDRAVEVWFERRPGHQMRLRTQVDQRGVEAYSVAQAGRDANGLATDPAADARVIDLGLRQGVVAQKFSGRREGGTLGDRSVAVELSGVSGAAPVAVTALIIRGAS